MPTNNEIIEENSFKLTRDWNSFKQVKLHLIYMLNEAQASKANQIDAILEEMEKRADFFYKDATDLANKTYERGYFDGIHNARAKIKEIFKVD